MQQREPLRAGKAQAHRNVQTEWRRAVVFKPVTLGCTSPNAQAVHRTRGIGLRLQEQMGLKSPDKLPFPNMLMVQPFTGLGGVGETGVSGLSPLASMRRNYLPQDTIYT